jgi:hypothetical protein
MSVFILSCIFVATSKISLPPYVLLYKTLWHLQGNILFKPSSIELLQIVYIHTLKIYSYKLAFVYEVYSTIKDTVFVHIFEYLMSVQPRCLLSGLNVPRVIFWVVSPTNTSV